MIKPNEKKTNRICRGCTKMFFIDVTAKNEKKFCNRDCYIKFLKVIPGKLTFMQKLHRFLNKYWAIFFVPVCFYHMTDNILFHSLMKVKQNLNCRNTIEVYELPEELDLELEVYNK
jgi:hypothetical protein